MEKFEESLEKAGKELDVADHMIYVTFPLIKDNKLLLRALVAIEEGVKEIINSILLYECYYKRISIYNNSRDNFETFKHICPSYNIANGQINRILEIFELLEKHRKSPFEFTKEDKLVIMSEGMKTDILTLEKVKFFLLEMKDFYRKAKNVILKRI